MFTIIFYLRFFRSGGSESFRFREPSFTGEISDFFLFIRRINLCISVFLPITLFGFALGMKSKKGDLDFFFVSLDLPSRSIRQFVCFPPIFCILFFCSASCNFCFLRVNFETLRNFVGVVEIVVQN